MLACVCLRVCEYVFVSALLLFFTDCRIHLFSSLAARLFNKLTRYSLLVNTRVLAGLKAILNLHWGEPIKRRHAFMTPMSVFYSYAV